MTESPETPTPSLADRLDELVLDFDAATESPNLSASEQSDASEVAADLRAAAAQLRQLDRIKAAVGMSDPAQVAESLIESGDLVVPSAVPVAVDLLRRLVDALDGDEGVPDGA